MDEAAGRARVDKLNQLVGSMNGHAVELCDHVADVNASLLCRRARRDLSYRKASAFGLGAYTEEGATRTTAR